MKLLYPDPCWRPDIVSGAAFLYFAQEPMAFTLHASVSTFQTGIDPFDFFRYVEEQKPKWTEKFFKFVTIWKGYQDSLRETSKLLEPLHGTAFKTIWTIYPRGTAAWDSATDLLRASALDPSNLSSAIEPFCAADELFSHIFFHRYLELYFPDFTDTDFQQLGQKVAAAGKAVPKVEVDWRKLYLYCDSLFQENELDRLLTTAYMFRMPMLEHMVKGMDSLLLSNERLINFLSSLPVQQDSAKAQTSDKRDPMDCVAWEFFRQLVSPAVDPLDPQVVKKLSKLRQNTDEIDRLKKRCLLLAHDLGEEPDLERLQTKIQDHIQANVEKELKEVLEVDETALRNLLVETFADQKTWAGIAGLLYAVVNGGSPLLTAGSAIYALGALGGKAFKEAATRRKKLATSDYVLLYRMRGIQRRKSTGVRE